MTMQEQELTLFGGWAKAQIPQPIGIGALKHSVTYSISTFIDTEKIYKEDLYQNISHVRWAAFFDALEVRYTYKYATIYDEMPPYFIMHERDDLLIISESAPNEARMTKLENFLVKSRFNRIYIFCAPIWQSNLRYFLCLKRSIQTSLYSVASPVSKTVQPIPLGTEISRFHIRALAGYGISLWIQQGKVYLYANGETLQYQEEIPTKDRLTEIGIKSADSRLRALLNYLPELQTNIKLNPKLREGSHFLNRETSILRNGFQHFDTRGDFHNQALDELIWNVKDNIPLLNTAYDAAQQAHTLTRQDDQL